MWYTPPGPVSEPIKLERQPVQQKPDRFDQMVSKVKASNLRMTPQRLAVLRILGRSQDHPTVDEIYAQVRRDFPTTSLATVYKTVGLLKELGEVLELTFSGGGARYDGYQPQPHAHLVCSECRTVKDAVDEAVLALPEGLSRRTGYRITGQRMEFIGVCPTCQAAASAAT